jgi:MFS family permease
MQQARAALPVTRLLLPRYLAAAGAARVADEGARVSLVLLALHETNSAAVGAAMVAALLVPHVVAAPLVGSVIDRARRPRWVLAAMVLVFATALLSVAQLVGRTPLWVVLAVLLLGGCCGPAITGGLTSQLPGLVGPEKAPRAFGWDSLFYNVSSMAGPALAGLTAAAAGPRAAQSLLAGSAALGAAGVAALPIAAHPRPCRTRRPSHLDGVREILHQRMLRLVTLSSALGQLGPGALPIVATLHATSLNRPAASGPLLAAVAAGSLLGSLLWTWHPVAPHRSPLVTTVSMIGIGAPLAGAAAASSIGATAVLFGLSGIFIGPFASALFTARSQYAAEAYRTQVFTIGAGLKVTASALGAAMIAPLTGLPVWVLLLIVSSSPLLAGLLGTLLLVRRPG